MTGVIDRATEQVQKSMHPFGPISKIHLGFHAYHVVAHDRSQVVESYHFCSGCGDKDDTVFQCLIYDSPEPNAKLLGIEYLITEKLFKELDEEEKKLWHSHKFEVSSGLLVPLNSKTGHSKQGSGGLCAAEASIEEMHMQLLYKTYGKIIHTWHPPSSKLPLGPPTLMMSSTDQDKGPAGPVVDKSRAGELQQKNGAFSPISHRDERHSFDTVEARKRRMQYLDLDYKTVEGSDAWQKGEGRQFKIDKCGVKLSDGTVLG